MALLARSKSCSIQTFALKGLSERHANVINTITLPPVCSVFTLRDGCIESQDQSETAGSGIHQTKAMFFQLSSVRRCCSLPQYNL